MTFGLNGFLLTPILVPHFEQNSLVTGFSISCLVNSFKNSLDVKVTLDSCVNNMAFGCPPEIY